MASSKPQRPAAAAAAAADDEDMDPAVCFDLFIHLLRAYEIKIMRWNIFTVVACNCSNTVRIG